MKTRERKIRTLSGETHLRFTLKRCHCHGIDNRSIPKAIVPEDSNFDMKMVIGIGILRWIMDYQRSEIQILMESRGVRVSTGEISTLSQEFLLRFYCIHRRHMKDLHLGEYILHLDGTGESGGDIVFMAKDGITGITMDACIMPSESSEYITPFLVMRPTIELEYYKDTYIEKREQIGLYRGRVKGGGNFNLLLNSLEVHT